MYKLTVMVEGNVLFTRVKEPVCHIAFSTVYLTLALPCYSINI